MRYYVTGEDGNRYGPADENVLRTWAAQGRITPTTLLEPELGGAGLSASSLPGLQFPPVAMPTHPNPQPYQNVYQNPYQNPYSQPLLMPSGRSSWEIQAGWWIGLIAAGLEFLCFQGGFLAGVGVIVCVLALMKGQRAYGPLLLNAAIVIWHVFITSRGAG